MNNEYQINLKAKSEKRKAGFTLIETLIAIAILVLAILGPLTIASNSLNTAYYARDQVTAFYLAQEGVEYLRELRDNNSIASNVAFGGTWDDSLIDGCLDNLTCALDPYPPGTKFSCLITEPCATVKYDGSTGLYRQSSDPAAFKSTNFKRVITIKKIRPDEDQITVLVSWTTGNLKSPNNFKITENLFNWQQGIGQTVEKGGGGDDELPPPPPADEDLPLD